MTDLRGLKAYSYIRMSTAAQLKGDSRRRQMELSAKYVKEHGLQLVDFDLQDIGVSAYRGANVTEGALGKFLEAAETKKIEAGSYLLVESLDRLSRQELKKSLSLFLRITDAGINIVTIADGHVYSAENTDLTDLIISLVILSRAHEESRTKGQRVSDAWSKKRANAKKIKLTRMCPAWLILPKNKNKFEVMKERAAIINSMFEDTAAGLGIYVLTKRLNERGTPIFSKSRRGWHNSYVSKILNNRATIGEFQPHKMVDGKRVADGEPIAGYFPNIVSEDLFYRAHLARRQRQVNGAGRKGKTVSNLFSGLAKCFYCGSPMKFENKGKPPRGATFLVCEGGQRGFNCSTRRWRYDEFEISFLSFVTEVDLSSVLDADQAALRRQDLEDKLKSIEGQLHVLKHDQNQTYELFLRRSASQNFLSSKLDELAIKIAGLETNALELAEQKIAAQEQVNALKETNDVIKTLIFKMREPSGATFDLRSRIAMRLRSMLKKIYVAPEGFAPAIVKDAQRWKAEGRVDLYEEDLERALTSYNRRRFFSAIFHNDDARAVVPDDADPYQFYEKEIEHEEEIIVIDRDGTETRFIHIDTTRPDPEKKA